MYTAWGSSASVSALNGISLFHADFTDDATCEVVANFINDATNLNWMEFYFQNPERPISIVVTPASAEGENDGTIEVKDCANGGQSIYSMSTARTLSMYVYTNSCDTGTPTRQRKHLRK